MGGWSRWNLARVVDSAMRRGSFYLGMEIEGKDREEKKGCYEEIDGGGEGR